MFHFYNGNDIIRTNSDILSIEPLGRNLAEFWIKEIKKLLFEDVVSKEMAAICTGLNVFINSLAPGGCGSNLK